MTANCGAHGSAASTTMTALARSRADRALADPDRWPWPRPRICHLDARRAAGDAAHRRILCPLRREQPLVVAVASSLTELFAPTSIASASPACWTTTLHRRRCDGLFQAAADAGAARRRNSRSPMSRPTRRPAPNRRPASTPCASNATCCGRSSTLRTMPM